MKLRQNLYYMAIFPYVEKFSILAKALLNYNKTKKKKRKNYCFWKMRERKIKLKVFPQQWVEAKEGLTLTAE